MKLRIFACLIASCIVSVAAAADPVPLSDAKIDFAKLKEWPDRGYTMTRTVEEDGTPVAHKVGRMVFTCKPDKKGLQLTNNTRMFAPDGKRFVEFKATVDMSDVSLFSPSSVTMLAVRSDGMKMQERKATVDGKSIKIVDMSGGREKESEAKWPANPLIDLVAFYLVTLLPQEKGTTFSTDSYTEISSLEKLDRRILECVGPDAATGTPDSRWVKFLSYTPGGRDAAIQYWVSSNGVLQRAQINKENRLDLESGESKEVEPKK